MNVPRPYRQDQVGRQLPALADGESGSFAVRYVVNEALPIAGGNLVLPPLDLLGTVIPEPSTLLLLASGLGMLATGRQRRS